MKYPISFELELSKNPHPGVYIALEGIDGSGKSTQIERLSSYFSKKGKEVVVTREPRKEGIIGDLVRRVLLGEEKLPSVSLQYLFSADRAANHQEVVLPALRQGKVVITDRCFWSAVVYGILDKNGGKYSDRDVDLLLVAQSILSFYHQFTVPDYTFLLEIPLDVSLARLGGKSAQKEIYESKSKISKVLGGYQFLRNKFPDQFNVIDGTKEESKVTKDILEKIEEML